MTDTDTIQDDRTPLRAALPDEDWRRLTGAMKHERPRITDSDGDPGWRNLHPDDRELMRRAGDD